jgi:hypothetical protein
MSDQGSKHILPATPPTHALGDVFAPSVDHATFVAYTIQFVSTHGQDGTVKLLSDAVNPPTTERAEARLAITDDAANVTMCAQLSYVVPAGHFVKLVAAGTGTSTITQQVETRLT